MRCVVFGDIHSNTEALSAVVAKARALQPDRYYSVGDIVGYGPDPEACLDVLSALSCQAVAGNHDQAVAGLTELAQFSDHAQAGMIWTQRNLGHAYVQCLKALPTILQGDGLCLVHATLTHPTDWEYVLTNFQAMQSIALQKTPVCFYGHTHVPVVYRDDGHVQRFGQEPIVLSHRHRYLINPGSVGQPRDGNPQACLLLFDSDAFSVQLIRCPYDIAKTQEKILQAGLPPFLADRLSHGK